MQIKSNISTSTSLDFLSGGGEMGRLMREYDWASSPLGTTGNWPQSLKTIISVLLNSRFPMFLFWGKESICFYNDAYRPSLGNNGKHPSALGQNGIECWPEIWPTIKPLIDQVLSGGDATWSEDQLIPIYRNGALEDVYWTFSYSPVKDESGQVGGVLVVCNETTEKVITQNALGFAVDAAELGTWDYNPVTNKFKGNNRLKNWFGVPLTDEVELTLAIEVMVEEDRSRVTEAIQKALQYESGGLYDIEYTIIHPDSGKERIVRAKGRAWFNDEKVAYRFNGTLQDVTSEAQARKSAKVVDENLRNVIAQAPMSMCFLRGLNFVVEIANSRCLTHWGKTEKEAIGKPIFNVLTDAKGKGFEELLTKVYTTGETYSAYGAEVPFTKDGKKETTYVSFVYQPYYESDGKISGILAVSTDVSKEVMARKQLEESELFARNAEEKARLAIDSADLGTYDIDLVTNQMNTSKRFNEIWGVKESVKREEFANYIHPEDREKRIKAHEQSIKTGNLHYEARLVQKNNLQRWIRVKGKVIYDEKGTAINLLGVIQDITEQKQFAEQLTKLVNERTIELKRSNEDLLRFAHIASHDLREPVRKVRTFALRLEDEYGNALPEIGKMYLEKIHKSTLRMIYMIDGVLAYSEINSKNKIGEKIDLNEVINNIEIDLELLIQEKKAIIKKDLLPTVEGNSVLMYQLFYNLINNALKFSKENQPVHIAIDNSLEKIEGKEFSKIVISDNGIGIEPEYTEQIFDAFARLNSKDKYEGTGLGLSLCRRIVEIHHGSIEATGIKDEGATFIIKLPLKQLK